MTNPIIEFKDVDMVFGEKTVLDKVSFTINKGETLAVLGPSGSGKSTILKLLIGLLNPTGGKIIVSGKDVAAFTEEDEWNEVRKDMGMVFQYSALFDFLSVGENVAFGLRQHTSAGEEDIQNKVKEMLEMVGMPGTENLYPVELSGGMKKRVSLARAIALDPGIVLYDEPTAGLDPIMANVISNLILKTKKQLGVTSILVTHDMASAFKASDRIALLNNAHIEAIGSVNEMINNPNPILQKFIKGSEFNPGKEKEAAANG